MPTGHRVARLLSDLGFDENPFALREVDRQNRNDVASFFFEHPLFSEVRGSSTNMESVIVLAKRGAGKTTFRQAIEFYCRNRRKPVEGILDVSYVDFSRPSMLAGQQGKPVDVYLHVEEILRCALTRLLEDVNEINFRRFAKLNSGDLATLSAYIRHYSRLLSAKDHGFAISNLLVQIGRQNDLDLYEESSSDFSNLLTSDSAEIISGLPPVVRPIADLLVIMRQQPHRPLEQHSYLQLMRNFLGLITRLGYKGMYVLIDRLDETSVFPNQMALLNFIKPLLTDLGLLDEENLSFKIFLPDYLQSYMIGKVDFRGKRLPVKHLVWSEDDLLSMLARRLRSFNHVGISSLQPFCEPGLSSQVVNFSAEHPRARAVDVALVRAASNLPRDLILRCRKLFELYEARGSLGLISQDDVDAATQADLGTDDPPEHPVDGEQHEQLVTPSQQDSLGHGAVAQSGLYIDANGNVWRDGKPLPVSLSPIEYKLLEYLFRRKYQVCTRRDILAAVWGPGHETATLNTSLKRLRDSVEYEPEAPRFILTQHGRGIQLVDPDPDEQQVKPNDTER